MRRRLLAAGDEVLRSFRLRRRVPVERRSEAPSGFQIPPPSSEARLRSRVLDAVPLEVPAIISDPQAQSIGLPRPHPTPRQRLRISTASFIGSREGLSRVRIVESLSEVVFATSRLSHREARPLIRSHVAKGRSGSGSWLNPYRKSPSRLRIRSHVAPGARPHTRARLSDAAPAASDKHRLLHRKPRRAVPGPDRGSIPIGSRPSRLLLKHPQPCRTGSPPAYQGALIGRRASGFG